MDQQTVIDLERQYYMPVFARYPVVLERGEGSYVYDINGKRYLDFLAGIAVNVLGHAHPALVKAISEQAAKIIHCSNYYYTRPLARLSERLAAAAGMDRVFIGNSGTEVNEGAIKLARKYANRKTPGKNKIITAADSFHGRTMVALMATGQPKYQQGFDPLPTGFAYVPYNNLAALEQAVDGEVCAVMLEPIQGEGGIHLPDAGYLEGVRKICDAHGALLILDEIQSGMGRTGKMFAYQHYNFKPDIITVAKGLGGGVPIGAFLATDEVAGAFAPGDHGTTFGGNPLACAAANAVLDVFASEGLPANAQAVGEFALTALAGLQAKHPGLIKQVRGKGLIIGVELTIPGKEIVAACLERGLIINCTANNVLRLVPALNISREQVDEMIAVLDQVMRQAAV